MNSVCWYNTATISNETKKCCLQSLPQGIDEGQAYSMQDYKQKLLKYSELIIGSECLMELSSALYLHNFVRNRNLGTV